jgi:hypothetical protein
MVSIAMQSVDYKYDVAFSFLAQDEGLATELNDLLQDRVRTFLYSKKQGEIAGKDGEQSFNTVFGEEARAVVVLYRQGWGETPWTRIEQTAIRNRAFEHGYDFAKFIPLDEKPTLPNWLPRTQIWIGLKRWGISAAAGVIEARIQELGGEPHEEDVLERAARLERSFEFSNRKKQFLNSYEGVKIANQEFGVIHEELGSLINQIKVSSSKLSFNLKHEDNTIVVLSQAPALSITWRYHYANSLNNAEVQVSFWRGHPPFPGAISLDKPTKLSAERFTFNLLPNGQYCWASSSPPNRVYTSQDLAAHALKLCMDHASPRNDRG